MTDDGKESPTFGEISGHEEKFIIPDGYRITGIYGTYSDHVTSLGFYLGKMPSKIKTQSYGSHNGNGFDWVTQFNFG